MDNKENLRNMLQDIINDRMDQAQATIHDYFIAKTREVAGLAAATVPTENVDLVDDTTVDDTVGEDTEQV